DEEAHDAHRRSTPGGTADNPDRAVHIKGLTGPGTPKSTITARISRPPDPGKPPTTITPKPADGGTPTAQRTPRADDGANHPPGVCSGRPGAHQFPEDRLAVCPRFARLWRSSGCRE